MKSASVGRVLILGGSGLIGPAVIAVLRAARFDVTVLNRGSRLVSDTTQVLANRNIPRDLEVAAAELGGFDVLIDLSCYTRRQARLAIAALASKTTHWVHMSSAAVYRTADKILHTEDDAIGGSPTWGGYGQEKSGVDEILLELDRDISVTILRPPYLYGPDNPLDRETFIWSRLLRGRPVLIPGDGTTSVQFLHVSDLARAVLVCIMHGKPDRSVYNIGPGQHVTLSGFVEGLARVCGSADSSLVVGGSNSGPARGRHFPFCDVACCVDDARFRQAFDWRSNITIDAGFAEAFRSYDRVHLCERPLDTAAEEEILEALAGSRLP